MFRILLVTLLLAGCNSVYIKPNTLDATKTVYADRGGYSMRRSIKERMEQRGYNIVVGYAASTRDDVSDAGRDIDIDSSIIPKSATYVIKVKEREEKFRPIWCSLNGFWWWNFNVSVAEQQTGKELMTWRGRGCANSSLRRLDRILDKLEIKNAHTDTINN